MRMTVVLIALLFLGMTLPARAQDQAPANAVNQSDAGKKVQITLPYPIPEFYLPQKDGVKLYIDTALDFVHPDNKALNEKAQRVADGVHEADQAYIQPHLDALDARARADQALAEDLASE